MIRYSFDSLDDENADDLGEALDRALASIPQPQTCESAADDLVFEEENEHVVLEECN